MAKRNFSSRQGGQWNDDGFSSKRMKTPDEVAVKFLLPNVVVGALLSRKAAALKRIRDQTCYNKDFVLKLSGKDQFYPGTKDERMIALVGPPPLVHRACCLLQDQIIDDPFLVTDESGTNDMGPRQGQMKIAVSDRAASKIIGSKGAVVKDISGHFNIAITITPSKEVIVPDERIVTILGPSRNVFDALEPIMHQISQQQTHISPEFDYYSQYSKPEGPKDEKKADTSEQAESAAALDTGADETAVKTEEASTEGNMDSEKTSAEPSENAVKSEAAESEKVDESKEGENAESKPEEEAVEIKAEAEETEENAAESQEGDKPADDKASDEKASDDKVSDEKASDDKPSDNKPSDEKPSDDDKKGGSDDAMKKLLKDPRKDGRWIWQSDRNNRPKWVWVENQKNSSHHNYSSQGQRRGRGGNRHRGGRY